MARVDASVAGGFDYLKLPDALETYVSTRLALYGQVLLVRVMPTLFSSRYTATVSLVTATEMTTEQLRTIIGQAFSSWNGVAANVTITSRGEASQPAPASAFDPFADLAASTKNLLLLGGVVAGVLLLRDVAR